MTQKNYAVISSSICLSFCSLTSNCRISGPTPNAQYHLAQLLLAKNVQNCLHGYRTMCKLRPIRQYGNQYHHKWPLQRFFSSSLLDFPPMEILGPYSKTSQDSEWVLILTDWHSKHIWAIPTSTQTATETANFFLDHPIISMGTRTNLLTENISQNVRRILRISLEMFLN